MPACSAPSLLWCLKLGAAEFQEQLRHSSQKKQAWLCFKDLKGTPPPQCLAEWHVGPGYGCFADERLGLSLTGSLAHHTRNDHVVTLSCQVWPQTSKQRTKREFLYPESSHNHHMPEKGGVGLGVRLHCWGLTPPGMVGRGQGKPLYIAHRSC